MIINIKAVEHLYAKCCRKNGRFKDFKGPCVGLICRPDEVFHFIIFFVSEGFLVDDEGPPEWGPHSLHCCVKNKT